jgi:hypothetical protein
MRQWCCFEKYEPFYFVSIHNDFGQQFSPDPALYHSLYLAKR